MSVLRRIRPRPQVDVERHIRAGVAEILPIPRPQLKLRVAESRSVLLTVERA